MLHESPTELAARVERNRIWMDTYGGDRGLAALTQCQQSSEEEESHKEEDGEEAKVCESVVVLHEETLATDGGEDGGKYEEDPPPSPEWDDQDADDVPQEPPVDPTYCRFCLHTPCLFLQWQDELERCVEIMHPDESNKAKRYHMYRRMTREFNGHLGKGSRKPLPDCFVQGLRDLYPEREQLDYTGFKYASHSSSK
jgi:hypothetical protein